MKICYAVPALVAVTALALTGCTNDDSAVKESSSNSASVVSAEEIMKPGVLYQRHRRRVPTQRVQGCRRQPDRLGRRARKRGGRRDGLRA